MTIAKILFGLIAGYLFGVAVGWGLVEALSTNTHDKAQEVAMTAFFVTGPIGAILGAGVGMMKAARTSK